eukprot:1810759-Amphidinium_carterae.1
MSTSVDLVDMKLGSLVGNSVGKGQAHSAAKTRETNVSHITTALATSCKVKEQAQPPNQT